jgi:hypothetical protein
MGVNWYFLEPFISPYQTFSQQEFSLIKIYKPFFHFWMSLKQKLVETIYNCSRNDASIYYYSGNTN